MHSSSGGSVRKVDSSAGRKVACTHMQASRHFDDREVCSHCGRPGNQGWIYRCTQDYDGRIPIFESGLSHEERQNLINSARDNGYYLPGMVPAFNERIFKEEEDIGDVSSLKPWMIKAIASGEYTPEQIEKLVLQRTKVKAVIKADELSVTLLHQKRLHYLVDQREQQKALTGYDGGPENPFGQWFVPYGAFDVSLAKRLESHRQAVLCEYRCCPSCRPIMRDRAWQAMDSVFRPIDPSAYPHDIDTRPLSGAKIVLGIDPENLNWSPAASMSSFDYENAEEVYAQELTEHMARRRSSSFFDNIRRVFADFSNTSNQQKENLNNKESSSSSEYSESQDLEDTDVSDEERSAALNVPRPESRVGDSWLIEAISSGDISMLTPSIMQHMQSDSIARILSLAASHQRGTTAAESTETYGNGEVHVAEGVALTEEAVDLGMADIITQV